MPEPAWEPAPPRPALAADEVHVWRASLAATPDELARYHAVLSADERERAARFRFEVHRDRFIAGRGIQRQVLARYLGADPAALRYRLAEHGKPALDGPEAAGGLRFNVSNSGDGLLIALALGRELGVDLEAVLPVGDRDAVARRFFSVPENQVYDSIPDEARDLAFFTCWTRKEAYIKAIGEGLTMPLDRFDVTLRPGEPAHLLCTRGTPDEAARWTLRELDPGPGWLGALAVEGGGWSLRLFDWDPARPLVVSERR
ncbi:4'-phosphopantetheinyl transferase family protein [Longimicrobium sp.]|uniref:4'-phosphopantetheinyl transferase family protein n=1 Tax=Longimicrobium sp. TaxID=2029185 RepID=UPI002C1664CA|nr:4'-phosphopantetheinyl transferase superfamily protein [Longimicrobium sp.]HSU14482.1 4'-phosphopantetheinyl transferase superfamily protein [Longimicrobium sp.]